METELLKKVSFYMSRAEYYFTEKRFDMSYNSYMDALYTIGAYLIYRDTGILLPAGQLKGMLRSRYPEVYEVLERYETLTDAREETVTALREEIERLMGMMTLPSPEE
jgi:hypothetical protein